MTAPDRLRWMSAAALASAVHAACFLPLLAMPSRSELSMEDLGTPMSIELAPASTAPDEGDVAAQDAEAAPAVAPVPEVDAVKSTRTQADLPTAEASPTTPPPDLQVAQKQTLEQQDEQQDRQTSEAQEARPEEASAPAAPSTAAAPAPTALADTIASAADGSTDKATQAVDSWQRSVLAHLGRHKRYPAQARTRALEGEVRIVFTVDRSGRVAGARVIRASGVAALDREALDMLARAQPLPALPLLATPEQGRLIVPVRYRLK